MRNFEPDELRALGVARNFLRDQSEWRCPACGQVAVRSYLYRADRPGHPTVISYTWCAACRRASGSTGPLPKGLAFDDPWVGLGPEERLRKEANIDVMFAELDQLWAKGVLPQRIRRSGGKKR